MGNIDLPRQCRANDRFLLGENVMAMSRDRPHGDNECFITMHWGGEQGK